MSDNTPYSDASDVCDLLAEQKDLLWRIYNDATEPPGKVMPNADLFCFLLYHALNIRELAKAALVLMESREPFGVAVLARPALESAFNLMAAMNDVKFGPQRMAFEMEDLARKLDFLLSRQVWPASRKPTPDQCRAAAADIRKRYNAPPPVDQSGRDRIKNIERIAEVAELTPLYDDEYRQLCLTVHSNQAGILNTGSGFMVRKGMLALCGASLMACASLCDAYQLRPNYDAKLKEHEAEIGELMRRGECLPDRQTLSGSDPSAATQKN